MPKVTYNDTVLVESDDTVVVENNHYFPREALNETYLQPTDHSTVCPWKGTATYYDVVIDGKTIRNGAWYYPEPKPAADRIRDHVAFYKSQFDIES